MNYRSLNANAVAVLQEGLSEDSVMADAVDCGAPSAAAAANDVSKQKSPFGFFIDDTLSDTGSLASADNEQADDIRDFTTSHHPNHSEGVLIRDESISHLHGNANIVNDIIKNTNNLSLARD